MIFSGTVTIAAPVVVEIPEYLQLTSLQVDSPGANTLEVATSVQGGAYIDQGDVSASTLKLDMRSITAVRLTATGGDMAFKLTPGR